MYVWYLSYGSNINTHRFHTYIVGGQFNDQVSEHGCRNKCLPLDEKAVIFNHELYFAGKFEKWHNQGVAFIKHDKNAYKTTFGKMYLIEKTQFEDVVKQENNMSIHKPLFIDYDLLNIRKFYDLNQQAYGRILQIGTDKNIPIYTFTSPCNRSDYNAPSSDYLETILHGIEESHVLAKRELQRHFETYEGMNHRSINNIIGVNDRRDNNRVVA